jgi:Xaa-Pro aminopeptidase
MIDASRRMRAVELLGRLELDALIFCQAENLRYLCGFTGSDGVLVVTADTFVFLTDARYTTQAGEEVIADRIDTYAAKAEGLSAALAHLAVQRIGFEASLAYGVYDDFRSKGDRDWSWQPLKEELQELRLLKTADEVAAIAQAAETNRAAFQAVANRIRPGLRENELALAIEYALRQAGGEEKAFAIIVASGKRGALPHGLASDKPLAAGELVTIDFGCRRAGYHSDETVTLAIGDVSADLRRIYDTVLEAHDRALAAVRPGLPLKDLDALARDYISTQGYGTFFGHGLGHGVGLEVHEAPVVSPRSQQIAAEGMVLTIEPGIYVPGTGGVRIEDMVLVTADGGRVLTKIPKTFHNILLN